MKPTRIKNTTSKEVASELVKRTGLDQETIRTIIYYYERIILKNIKAGYNFHSDLIDIYKTKKGIEVVLIEAAKRYLKI
jgi:hypothetical protein